MLMVLKKSRAKFRYLLRDIDNEYVLRYRWTLMSLFSVYLFALQGKKDAYFSKFSCRLSFLIKDAVNVI